MLVVVEREREGERGREGEEEGMKWRLWECWECTGEGFSCGWVGLCEKEWRGGRVNERRPKEMKKRMRGEEGREKKIDRIVEEGGRK